MSGSSSNTDSVSEVVPKADFGYAKIGQLLCLLEKLDELYNLMNSHTNIPKLVSRVNFMIYFPHDYHIPWPFGSAHTAR